MSQKELYGYTKNYARIHGLDLEKVHPLSKEDLIVGREYRGMCRNTVFATWNGKQFEYKRHKFGKNFKEKINHFEDDNGYDVFVPFDIMG